MLFTYLNQQYSRAYHHRDFKLIPAIIWGVIKKKNIDFIFVDLVSNAHKSG
jgi:hypothetical protein